MLGKPEGENEHTPSEPGVRMEVDGVDVPFEEEEEENN